MIELGSSNIRDFKLTICEGRVVVRSHARIAGLIGVRESKIPSQFHGLLAIPIFSGTGANEEIIWATDIFKEKPKRISELNESEKEHYSQILSDALQAYADAISDATEDVKNLLYAAITYIPSQSIYCAEDRVVITEWGMTPIDGRETLGMPIGIDKNVEEEVNRNPEVSNAEATEEEVVENSKDNPKEFLNDKNSDTETLDKPHVEEEKKPKNLKFLYWLLPLILAIIAIAICILINGCSSPMKTVVDTNPAIDSDKIVLNKDSVNFIVSNRLILVLGEKEAKMEDFVKAFRNDYPDSKRYILSSPDSILNRITLTLPAEEREMMETELPVKYSEFGLIVVPDAMYRHSSVMTNDADLSDSDKRWYLDECGVFDAWEVTMGSDDVVVAIIDDGFDLNHDELKNRAYLPFNAVNHTDAVTPSPSGHGTHVASTAIGTAGNSSGLAGIAPKCKFMPIQVGDSNGNMSSSAILDGVLYAIANGADVVNMSLGMYFGPGVQYMPIYLQQNIRNFYFKQEEQMWNQIFEMARQRGVTFVLAGGNENILIGIDPMSRSNATIKVSAVGPGRNKANFSNYGDLSTVSAPGVHIFSAIPNNNYTFMDGTSMAAPVVTGGCALLKSNDRSLTTSEMAYILRTTGNASMGPIGPTVNFANALSQNEDEEEVPDPDEEELTGAEDDCGAINRRYNELLAELNKIQREHPGCIQKPDTLTIPRNVTPEKLVGKWKSTTALQNKSNEEVVIYFTFNGTKNATLEVVEPSGKRFKAPLTLKISNDIIYVDQTQPATSNGASGGYNPYKFIIRPNRNRNAEGKANSKVEAYNAFNFSLVRI